MHSKKGCQAFFSQTAARLPALHREQIIRRTILPKLLPAGLRRKNSGFFSRCPHSLHFYILISSLATFFIFIFILVVLILLLILLVL